MQRKTLVPVLVVVGVAVAGLTIYGAWNYNLVANKYHLIEDRLDEYFRAGDVTALDSIFTKTIDDAVTFEYMLFLKEQFVLTCGEYVGVVVDPHADSFGLHAYDATFEHGHVVGSASVDLFAGKINAFYYRDLVFSSDYIESVTLDDLAAEFAAIPGNHSLLITRGNETLLSINPDTRLATGSAFKMFVLKALVETIKNNATLDWDYTVPIQQEYKSLPSGILHLVDEGTPYTLEDLAHYMINISDNTATDHLIWFLGREAVESWLPTGYDLPLLTTGEMFKLRYMLPGDVLDAYLEMSTSERRDFLENNVSRLNLSVLQETGLNVSGDLGKQARVEWWFSARELLGILEEVRDEPAMHDNPGLVDPASIGVAWQQVAFKGGSDFGVLSLSHAMQDANGTWFSCFLIANNFVEWLPQDGGLVYQHLRYFGVAEKIIDKLAMAGGAT